MDEVHTRQRDGRARKVAAARKKLDTFRASRSSASSSSFSSTSPVPSPDPLTTDNTNIPNEPGSRSPKKSRGKGHPSTDEGSQGGPSGPSRKLRKPRSKPSLASLGESSGSNSNGRHIRGHSRQASSIAGAGSFGLARGTVMDLFEGDRVPVPLRGDLPPFPTIKSSPGRIVTTPATPSLDISDPEFEMLSEPGEDTGKVKTRLDTFSFGAKAPPTALRRSVSPQAPPTRRFGSPIASPSTTPTKRLSTPSAHGPSLLLTRPTPLAFSASAPPSERDQPPGTPPPTPARTKRHSHTRSNSISMPNLKLSTRPPSLGIPVSPSFPTSPSSPMSLPRPANVTPLQGTRLKFEPSGRGAEAEKEKDDYRRKALEKLTGSPLPDEAPLSGTEISLPDLDDEDSSSVASSVRPFSGTGGFNFGRPMSSSSTPGLSWSSGNEDSPPPGDRWSGFSFGLEKEDGLGFGLPLTTSFSAPTFGPGINEGMTVPTIPSRPSLQRNLSVLAEVEEPEEGDETMEQEALYDSPDPEHEVPSTHATPKEKAPLDREGSVPIIAPTPSRLRQLHLLSSHSTSSISTPSASSIPAARHGSQVTPGSPTKGYGTIGRGRPRPLTLAINSSQPASASPVKSARTPQSASERRGTGRGGSSRSRGSSISYVKPESTSSAISTTASTSISGAAPSSVTSTTLSRDWSISSSADIAPPRNLFFSPPLGQSEWSPSFASPPLSTSPKFSGWGNIGRSGTSRPCPRPKSIVGLGDGKGSGRILGEVAEAEEEELDRQPSGSKMTEDSESAGYFDQAFDVPHDAPREWRSPDGFPTNVGGSFSWRDPQLELEMERDALREDVDLWKARCGGLEERLELEKKEVVVLRERVRKLGDRLSAVQSSHPSTVPRDRDNSGLLAEMRTQLFTLTAQLEQERRDKETASQLADSLQAQLSLRSTSPTPKPSLLLRPTDRVPMAIVTPATPLDPTHPIPTPTYSDSRILQHCPSPPPTEPTSSPGPRTQSRPVPFGHEPLSPAPVAAGPVDDALSPKDTNDTRMRAWGFPAAPAAPSSPMPRNRDRDSFFGLSNPLQRNSIDGRDGEQGMDLPPFDYAPLVATSTSGSDPRTVSDPLPITSPVLPSTSPNLPRSSSLTSSASSAISFFSGYLPSFSPPTKNSKQRNNSMFGSNSWLGRAGPDGLRARDGSLSTRLPPMGSYSKKGPGGELDFRASCRCCVGEVMEL